MARVRQILFVLLLVGAVARADFDLSRPPTAQDLAEIRRIGWAQAADMIEGGLTAAWKPSHFAQAGSTGNATFRQWQLLYRWCRLLGTPEPEALRAFLGRRVLENPEKPGALLIIPPGMSLPTDATGRLLPTAADKLSVARVPAEILQGLLPDDYTPQAGPVSLRAKEDFLAALASDPGFLREFFRLLTPDDFAPVVLTRLEQLYSAHPGRWADYRSLMLAFALVYDQRPPSFWPHAQVRQEAVQPMDEPLADRLGYYIQANENRRLEFDLRRLPAEQLKFLVDAPVPRSELEWAAKNVKVRRDQFDRAFSLVAYDKRRVERGVFSWPHGRYLLGNIELQGGICVDQAYFASIAGKAKGIPTIYFAGQGTDGGHAWFGYLQSASKWELDAGRYLNQNFTVGQALDPQTWLPITDHELLYLSGRAARGGNYDAALGDLAMAAVFERKGDAALQLAAATSALYNAPESVAAWEAKEAALAATGDRAALQAHFRSAIEAFRRQDDLKVRYQARLAELERDGGDARAAQRLADQMVRENRRERADLSTAAGSEAISRLLGAGDYEGAMREYRDLTSKLGRTGGGNLFYNVVRPFVLELRAAGREQDAQKALQRARDKMHFEKDSILAREFSELEAVPGSR
ncbi:MAG: hypothetical protein IAE97_07920 [Chthoniobacterales bacterium]|nr:hypothetical protein [Chthoniobacterales bacterium]